MKMSEVFLMAAEEVDLVPYNDDRHQAACDAIGERRRDAKEYFANFFCPAGKIRDEFWFGTTKEPENKQPRVLALLFAAQIAKDEGK